jgi:Trk K+ transport system NAD-binding subunit
VVYAEPPFSGPKKVFGYLRRYTHRVAVSNHRIRKVTDESVALAARDGSTTTLDANTIINLLKPGEVLMFEEGLNVLRAPVPSSLVGKSLAENEVRKQTGCSVVAIFTQSKLNTNVDPSIPLGEKDEMISIGTANAEKRFFKNY